MLKEKNSKKSKGGDSKKTLEAGVKPFNLTSIQ